MKQKTKRHRQKAAGSKGGARRGKAALGISDGATPIYKRARQMVTRWIESGKYRSDEQLPSERDLSEQLGISRMTARHVYVTMQNDGLLYRTDRKGWFVAQPKLQYALKRSVSFVTNVRAVGGTPHARLLEKATVPASAWLADELQVPREELLVVARRLLSVGKRRAMIEVIYMPASRFPGLMDMPLDQSISQLWKDHYQVEVSRAEAKIQGGTLPAEDATELQAESMTAAIKLVEKMFDAADRPIALSIQNWRNDIAEFTIDVDFGLRK
ncbi:MAG TPA: GntR family transcriptional regulator [Candidatus Sulfotelmatobacter sp.]|nr:GntR family transcriptional regulator [Candidatus Sulfotelmatobacter sp.]